MKLNKEEQLKLKKFEAWMDEHEEVVSVGIGAFIVTLAIGLAIALKI